MRALILGGVLVAATVAILALTLRPPQGLAVPTAGFVLADVTVLEPGHPARAGLTVRGAEQITSVEVTSPQEGGRFSGTYVLPGLVDLHVHHPPRFAIGERELFALLFLSHGVTSVRDTGAVGGNLLDLRRRLLAGETAGPRLFACGPPLDDQPSTWSGSTIVTNSNEARAAVSDQATAGFDCVKLYNGLSADAVRGAEEEAMAQDLPVVGHVPDGVAFGEIRDTEVQHLMGLVSSNWDEAPEPLIARYVQHSVRERIAHLPTMVAIARWGTLDDDDLAEDPSAQLLPPHYRELFWNPARNPLVMALAPSQGSEAIARLSYMRSLVRRLHAAGVPLLAGTDTMNPFVVPGAALLEEFAHFESAGLTPTEILANATRGAARALGRSDLGTVRVGATADLLVLRQDPTNDLAALQSLEAVIVGGRLYTREALDNAVNTQRRHWEHPAVRTFWNSAAQVVLLWIRLFEV